MNQTPQNRAERRREAREQWKKNNGSVPAPVSPAQWPLLLACTGFLFSCLCFSLVGGMNLWSQPSLMPKIVGWAGVWMVLIGSFEMWRRYRSQFVWRKRWTFYFAGSFFVGLVLAVLWTTAIGQWQARDKFDNFLHKHAAVIEASEQWTPGTAWSDSQCSAQETNQHKMLTELFRSKEPPALNEVGVLISIQQVSYQAGCKDQWNDMKNFMLNIPASWEGKYPKKYAQVMAYLNEKWPNSYMGCQMEFSRAKTTTQLTDKETQVFDMLCQQAQILQHQVWAPGTYTNQMKAIVKEQQ